MDKEKGSPILAIKNLSKTFDGIEVLNGISLNVYKGDVIAIIGASGGGKSTLLRCINQLEKPDSGQIVFAGKNINDPGVDINRIRTKMGMVFQQFNLFNNMNVIKNCMYAQMKVLRRSESEAKRRAMDALSKVGMVDHANYNVHALSGGQKQRVAIARALVMNPEIMLFDEPTSALDPKMIGEVLKVMKDLADAGMTMLVVTHEMSFAKNVANKVVFIYNGRIREMGYPKYFFTDPITPEAKEFLQGINH